MLRTPGQTSEGVRGEIADPWPAVARGYCTRWREELMTPGPGTLLAREEPT